MPSWLGPLDVADKVASVLSLLVAMIALIVSIHFARKATGTRALSVPRQRNRHRPRVGSAGKSSARSLWNGLRQIRRPVREPSPLENDERDYSTIRPIPAEILVSFGIQPKPSPPRPAESTIE
ncbi:hypothetical protein [Nonomuraea sp. NPDC050540]|uniref:hypothetical protein n=1 Tax=Nonomuraea sp. NPDC050540 TaxID=3364367 RepID=UPI003791B0B0